MIDRHSHSGPAVAPVDGRGGEGASLDRRYHVEHVYWRDCSLPGLSDEALAELVVQLDALTRNAHIAEHPELLFRVGARLADCLHEVDMRLLQQLLF